MNTFRKTAEYDIAIADWLASELDQSDWRAKVWHKISDLRYGENPHQGAAVFSDPSNIQGISSAKQHHGKEMSFNNFTDADAALRAAFDHTQPCVAIIKHANPCGIAIATDIKTAYIAANACDPVSAFGGVVAANRTISVEMATGSLLFVGMPPLPFDFHSSDMKLPSLYFSRFSITIKCTTY
jgi:phosphoribosylaminoimidazolecarboxamide formyltransferase/IMP cyclohydrolase